MVTFKSLDVGLHFHTSAMSSADTC